MPSILDLCGVRIPDGVQGTNVSHVFRNEAGKLQESVYMQILGPGWPDRTKGVGLWRGIRTQRYTYARWHLNEFGPVLYDHETDEYVMMNLAGTPEHRRIENGLESLLRRWMKQTDDPFETGSREEETQMLQLGQEFIHPKWKDVSKSTHWT